MIGGTTKSDGKRLLPVCIATAVSNTKQKKSQIQSARLRQGAVRIAKQQGATPAPSKALNSVFRKKQVRVACVLLFFLLPGIVFFLR